jgi:hypothetical protein
VRYGTPRAPIPARREHVSCRQIWVAEGRTFRFNDIREPSQQNADSRPLNVVALSSRTIGLDGARLDPVSRTKVYRVQENGEPFSRCVVLSQRVGCPGSNCSKLRRPLFSRQHRPCPHPGLAAHVVGFRPPRGFRRGQLLSVPTIRNSVDTPLPNSFNARRTANCLLKLQLSLGGHNQVLPTNQPLTTNSEWQKFRATNAVGIRRRPRVIPLA